MIKDITGIELTPGNCGKDCKGNGEHYDENGELLECCCDECDYMMCCLFGDFSDEFEVCDDVYCSRSKECGNFKIIEFRENWIKK